MRADFPVILRYVRYQYVRDAICVVAFLTIAIWILEVFSFDMAHSTIRSGSHSHADKPQSQRPSAQTAEQVNQLHELSTVPDDAATTLQPRNLAETFVWDDAS